MRDSLLKYTNHDTRMMELLGLHGEGYSEAANDVNWREIVGRHNLLFNDQRHEQAGANEIQDDHGVLTQICTRISFELHPRVFFRLYFGGTE